MTKYYPVDPLPLAYENLGREDFETPSHMWYVDDYQIVKASVQKITDAYGNEQKADPQLYLWYAHCHIPFLESTRPASCLIGSVIFFTRKEAVQCVLEKIRNKREELSSRLDYLSDIANNLLEEEDEAEEEEF